VVFVLLALNLAAFGWESMSGQEAFQARVDAFGLRPAVVTAYLRGNEEITLELPRLRGGRVVTVEETWLPDFRTAVCPFLFSMFLHGSLFHLLSNLWFLWIFADNVEGRLGHIEFAVFYLVTGLAAGVTHVALAPDSPVPCVGASGAISGVLGAYLFHFPRARVLTLVPLGFFLQVLEVPALLFLLIWFGIQVFSVLGSSGRASGVAWWAHIGGFVAGLALAALWGKRGSSDATRASP